jgi:hypothetical protein
MQRVDDDSDIVLSLKRSPARMNANTWKYAPCRAPRYKAAAPGVPFCRRTLEVTESNKVTLRIAVEIA